jgi:hypothetical protein
MRMLAMGRLVFYRELAWEGQTSVYGARIVELGRFFFIKY